MSRSRIWKSIAVVSVLSVAAVACANNDDAASGDDNDAYCALAVELDGQEGFPSAEQFEALRDAVPEEIRDEVNLVVERVLQAIEDGNPGAAFADPDVEAAFKPIDAFENEVCGLELDNESEQDASVTELDPNAAQVAVSATEYAFEFQDPAAGPTSFTMSNDGDETHVMVLFKLAAGSSIDEVLATEGGEGLTEVEFSSDGANPGEEAVLTADLTPGKWAMICYIPDAKGKPHFDLGMVREFTIP